MTEGVQQLADIVFEYCHSIEHRQEFDRKAFVLACARLLSSLYRLALELPDVSLESPEVLPSVISQETWREIAGEIGEKFGDHSVYWLVFDPFELMEPVAGHLSDDLTDIYGELLAGLRAFQAGTDAQRIAAIWHWRFGFEVHWGRHLVTALRPIQSMLVEHRVEE